VRGLNLYSRQPPIAVDMHPAPRLTSFANAEELIDVPGDNAAGESAPTPLEDAAQRLSRVSITAGQHASAFNRTNGSVRRSSVASPSPLNWPLPSYAALKNERTKLREALVSDVGRNGSSTNGMSRAVSG
jgi:hypothetical protein